MSLKRSCKSQFRGVDLRSIGPSSQELWPNQNFGRFSYCNYNVKLQMDGPETFMGLWIWNLVSPNRADVLNIKAEIKKMLEPTSQPFYQLFLVLPEADFLRVSQIVVDRQTQCFHALKALRKIHDPPYKICQTPQILKYTRAHCRVLIFLHHFCGALVTVVLNASL